jgi:hypothetical protein
LPLITNILFSFHFSFFFFLIVFTIDSCLYNRSNLIDKIGDGRTAISNPKRINTQQDALPYGETGIKSPIKILKKFNVK